MLRNHIRNYRQRSTFLGSLKFKWRQASFKQISGIKSLTAIASLICLFCIIGLNNIINQSPTTNDDRRKLQMDDVQAAAAPPPVTEFETSESLNQNGRHTSTERRAQRKAAKARAAEVDSSLVHTEFDQPPPQTPPASRRKNDDHNHEQNIRFSQELEHEFKEFLLYPFSQSEWILLTPGEKAFVGASRSRFTFVDEESRTQVDENALHDLSQSQKRRKRMMKHVREIRNKYLQTAQPVQAPVAQSSSRHEAFSLYDDEDPGSNPYYM